MREVIYFVSVDSELLLLEELESFTCSSLGPGSSFSGGAEITRRFSSPVFSVGVVDCLLRLGNVGVGAA